MPFEVNYQGRPTGMTSDLMDIFSEKLNISFKMVPISSWSESLYSVKTGKSDLLSMVSITGMEDLF